MGMKAETETMIVRACLDLLAMRGIMAWRQNQGGMLASYNGKQRFLRFAGVKGISDIIGLLNDGRFLAVECKKGKGKLSDDQAAFLDAVRKRGGLSMCVRSVAELNENLNRELAPAGVPAGKGA